MLDFIFATDNLPFTVALAVMLVIALLEGVGALVGAGFSDLLDQLVTGSELDVEVQAPDLDSPTALEWVLSCFRVQRVPILVLLVIWLLSFGLGGLFIQDLFQMFWGRLLPLPLAAAAAFAVALPLTRWSTGVLARILPKDESDAVSQASLIGLTARVTLGEARAGSPAQAVTRDHHGQSHYFLLEPDSSDEAFAQGEEALLVRFDGLRFYGIRPSTS